jgi:catalase
MANVRSLLALAVTIGLAAGSGCPYGHTSASNNVEQETLEKRDTQQPAHEFLKQFIVNDTDVYLTSDVGGPIEDQNSLKAGERGPTLLEDFIFRQKITHFDHERVSNATFVPCPSAYSDCRQVPERAVHARGAGKR